MLTLKNRGFNFCHFYPRSFSLKFSPKLCEIILKIFKILAASCTSCGIKNHEREDLQLNLS
ncbi:hypothetical protein CAMGR0001_2044 [Campylobacter gracilis RM3268]|uniref:Uncharacterized protein n=1 Tax=Campylobacter gracilis RM3268 TaxID=553220 RepID=C8PLN4_9BACT|nr:hypothetical protein CAMGR0001_2044 [Campylobacter gracilis RM3268]